MKRIQDSAGRETWDAGPTQFMMLAETPASQQLAQLTKSCDERSESRKICIGELELRCKEGDLSVESETATEPNYEHTFLSLQLALRFSPSRES